jgi:hypothetical protein
VPPASTAAWQQSLLKHGDNESGRRYGNDDQGHGTWVNKGKRKGQSPMLGSWAARRLLNHYPKANSRSGVTPTSSANFK